jgi:xanthine dehydrogenase accessory factor
MSDSRPAELTDEQRAWEATSEVHGPNFAPARGTGGDRVRLVIFGAVPLAAVLCRTARAIDWVPFVVDPRERFARRDQFTDAEEIVTAWPQAAFTRLGGPDERTAVAVLTHAPELDDPALILALRSSAFYVGAMGSRRTQSRRRERLAAAGLSEAELDGLSGPAGLDIGGETAAEAALAILAEAVAALHGREGARLTVSPNAIHPAGRR